MQYFGIRKFGTLSVREEAILAAGLPAESRIVRKLSGIGFSLDQLLMAGVLDQLRVMNWSRTKDAKHKRNFPKPILDELIKGPAEKAKEEELETFDSGTDFKRRLAQIKGEGHGERN